MVEAKESPGRASKVEGSGELEYKEYVKAALRDLLHRSATRVIWWCGPTSVRGRFLPLLFLDKRQGTAMPRRASGGSLRLDVERERRVEESLLAR